MGKLLIIRERYRIKSHNAMFTKKKNVKFYSRLVNFNGKRIFLSFPRDFGVIEINMHQKVMNRLKKIGRSLEKSLSLLIYSQCCIKILKMTV